MYCGAGLVLRLETSDDGDANGQSYGSRDDEFVDCEREQRSTLAFGTHPLHSFRTEGERRMVDEMVLTVIARDRPGLVKALSEMIAQHGGNWIDSSMCCQA